MLHGRAADASLIEFIMDSAGWLDSPYLEFAYVDAPHPCAARPELYVNLESFGLYDAEKEYFTWGLDSGATAESVELVERSVEVALEALAAHAPLEGIAGMCDGSIIAAIVASRHPLTVGFYLNFCGGPLTRVAERVRRSMGRIHLHSLHFIGDADELYTQDELQTLPRHCNRATVLTHELGHVVPNRKELFDEAVGALISLGAEPRPDRRPAVEAALVEHNTPGTPDVGTRGRLHRWREAGAALMLRLQPGVVRVPTWRTMAALLLLFLSVMVALLLELLLRLVAPPRLVIELDYEDENANVDVGIDYEDENANVDVGIEPRDV